MKEDEPLRRRPNHRWAAPGCPAARQTSTSIPGSAAGRACSAVVNFVAITFTNDSALVRMPGGAATPLPEDVRTPIPAIAPSGTSLSLGQPRMNQPDPLGKASAPLNRRNGDTNAADRAGARPALKDPPDRLSTRLLPDIEPETSGAH